MKKKAGVLICTCIFIIAAFGPAIAEYRLSDTGQTSSYYSEENIITCQNTDQSQYVQDVSNNGSDPVYLSKGAGTQKWAFQAGDDVNSSPAIGSDGTVYVGSYDNKVYALNPNGTKKWAFQAGDRVWSSPAIAPDGTVYVGT
ncbi:MAG: PQQ-binding-like beta-propeller repeat protein, partial [Deltaproteobacteria bacterium]|nr:PQQ-binding-like beta-propeller repeat protein [Deltaproteobacteria bacterium]